MAVRGALAALALALLAAPAEARTVTYYLGNPDQREQQLARCVDDEAEARRPDCANAQRAADIAARQRRRPAARVPTPAETLASPRYYTENAIARAITLNQCERGLAPLSDCAAARAAGR